jgi:hypothetical protein
MKFAPLAVALATALTATASLADEYYTETFSAAPLSNAAWWTGQVIAGTALQVVSGYAWIGNDAASGRGNVLDLASGSYSPNFDFGTGIGSSSVQSVATFDLIAGYQYTLSFDYSRQTFSAGNGPFPTSLIASLGSHSVQYDDVAGFYYGFDWQSGGISWTQQATELGARVVFTATGPGGYSGMDVDNISMVGLPPAQPVPEPEHAALLLAGLAIVGFFTRRTAVPFRR